MCLLDRGEDDDDTPAGANLGDGFDNFDEYRCFKVGPVVERASAIIKHMFVTGYSPTGGIGHNGVWEFAVQYIGITEREGALVNFNGDRNQNAVLAVLESFQYPNEEDPLNPQVLAVALRATPNAPGQLVRMYDPTCTLHGLTLDDRAWVLAHETGHDVCVRHNEAWDPDAPSGLMNETFPHPNAINDQNRQERRLH